VSVQGLATKFAVVQLRDYDGEFVCVKLPRADLKAFHKFRHALEDAGYEFPADLALARQLHQVIAQMKPHARWELVDRVGWHDNEFVLPNTPAQADGKVLRFESEKPEYYTHYTRRGTLSDWQRLVAGHALHSSRLIFAISLAFAAPLMRFASIEPGGFHLFGKSTKGKTTCLIAASSVVGPGIRSELLNWDITDAGLEEVAAGHNDSLLCLDETGQIRTDATSSVAKKLRTHAFKLAGGRGRLRSSLWGQRLGARVLKWRLLFLSTGELALSDLASEAEINRLKGEEVRLIDLPAVIDEELGIYETLPPGFSTADEALLGIAAACEANCGVAFEALLSKVRANMQAMDHAVQRRMKIFMKAAQVPTDAWERRFAQRFAHAFAAADIAAEFGIVPWSRQVIGWAIRSCYLAARAAVPDARQLASQGLAVLRSQLAKKEEVLDLRRAGHKVSWTQEQVEAAQVFRRSDSKGAYFLVEEPTFLSWFGSPLQVELVLEELERGRFLVKTTRNLRKIQTPIAGIDGKRYYYAILETVLSTA